MGDLHVKYLLIGGGLASFAAAAAIRQIDKQGPLLLIGQEINRPYRRGALSKTFLRRKEARSALFTCEPDWFVNHGVQLRTGLRAAHVDSGRSIVTLGDGETISYDRLLLATGCAPRPLNIPGERLPNVFTPRTVEDYEQLLTAAHKAHAEGHRHGGGRGAGRGCCTVIGGGLLGVEIAASLTESELEVDLVVGATHAWPKFAGESTGRFLSLFLSSRGIRVHEGARAQRIEGDGRAQRVVLGDGRTLTCDFVVAAVGTSPNKEMLRGTGIVAEQAILADERCRTNVPDVFAAGDCAAVRDPVFGKHRPPGPWDTAESTGTVAGVNMAGGDMTLQAVASFSTEALGLKARCWGQSKHVQRRIMRGPANVESADFVEIGVAGDDRISQMLAVGHSGDETIFEELVRRRAPIAGHEEGLKDPGWPLEKIFH
jgi:3-phenylpropionate/trans-cinnamate dioxygenase ferredoxin reductase component